MKGLVVGIGILSVAALGVYALKSDCMHCMTGTSDKDAVQTAAASHGSSLDPVLSQMCRFSCAAPEDFASKDVIAQPGAADGKPTRCPVSGVVFVVDEDRPRLQHAGGEYVFCCDLCAKKFAEKPLSFVGKA